MTTERKYILIIGVILLLLGLIYRFYPEIQGFHPAGEDIGLKENRLIKYQKMVQKKNELNAALVSLTRTLERAESVLLTGETPALAAVDIQNILNKIASQSHLEIQTMRVLKPEEPEEGSPGKGIFLIIPVQVSFTSTIRQFKEFIYGIETSFKLLRITDMSIRTNTGKEKEEIYASLTIEGFIKKKESEI